MENLGKRSGITDIGISNRIQEIEERISDVVNTIEEIDTALKENSKHKNLLIQEIQETMKRPNLRIFRIEKNEVSQL
jgi:methyl-accepting chemotaxis protein